MTGSLDVAAAVRSAASALAIDATTLLRALSGLAPIGVARIEWSDAGDRLAIGVPWDPRDRAAFESWAYRDRMQAATIPVITARVAPSWIGFETVPRKTDALATELGVWGPCDPAAVLAALTSAGTRVKPAAAERMSLLWPRTGAACDLFVDRAQPPLGPSVWKFSGPIAGAALVTTAEALIAELGIRDAHRALVHRLASCASLRIGLHAVFDGVHPVLEVSARSLSWDEARELVAAATRDPVRADRVVAALSAAGAASPSVTLRLATEDPIRVRVDCPLRDW